MRKRIISILILSIIFILPGCQQSSVSDIANQANHVKEDLTSYQQSISDTHLIGEEVQSYQLSDADVVDEQVIKGTLIIKNKQSPDMILELIQDNQYALSKQNNEAWYSSPTPQAQSDHIKIYEYQNLVALLMALPEGAKLATSYNSYTVTYKGSDENFSLLYQSLFNLSVGQDLHFDLIAELDKDTLFIKSLDFTILEGDKVQNLLIDYRHHNNIKIEPISPGLLEEASIHLEGS